MTDDFGKHGRSFVPSCIKKRGRCDQALLLKVIFLKWLHLVGQDYFSGTPAHSRLNTEHRSDDLDETVV